MVFIINSSKRDRKKERKAEREIGGACQAKGQEC
jgi:hypothetical protein